MLLEVPAHHHCQVLLASGFNAAAQNIKAANHWWEQLHENFQLALYIFSLLLVLGHCTYVTRHFSQQIPST
jgi:hypothetical protein